MPPPAHERYGELVATMRAQAVKASTDGLAPEAVAEVIVEALTAARPRTRYVIGREAKIQAGLARVLPGRAMDTVLARIVEQSLRLWNNRAHVTASGPARLALLRHDRHRPGARS